MNSSSDRHETDRPKGRRKPRIRKPLDETSLRDLALAYAARFATTGAKVEAYLARKIRERGVAEDADGRTLQLDVPALVTRLIELGYVDDDAYARMKSRDLTARGYGKRRVEQALYVAGVDEQVRGDNAPSEARSREAAALLARKRRFGPYGVPHDVFEDHETDEADRAEAHKKREKQIAAMLRAGHLMDHVRFILEATNVDDIEAWIEEAREEDEEYGGL